MTKKITIPPPDEATVLAARHLDETEGPAQIGTLMTASTRGAINRVLRYIAMAHNAPAAESGSGCAHCGGPHAWDDCEAYTALVADEAQQAETQATPCGPPPDSCEPGGEPCARHEREQSHADGEHELCGDECAARTPTHPVYIWTIGGRPETGSLDAYATAWALWRRGRGPVLSKTVLTWDDTSDPLTWNVTVTPLKFCDDGRRLYSITVASHHGEVHVLVPESAPA